MRNLLENSCAKGCLVYLLALVIIVGLTTLGLGGLSAKFGVGAQSGSPQTFIFTTPQQPATRGSSPAAVTDSAATVTPVSEIAPPLVGPAPQSAPQAQSPSQPQAQVQAGAGISGEASSPFYIVQPGDTLWGISLRYDVGVDALRSINSIADNFIQPGQLLYLPTGGPTSPQPVVAPTATTSSLAPVDPQQNQGGGAPDPGMPHTGINRNP
jgi:LysM repeat protein